MQRNLVKIYFNKKKKSLIIKLTKIFEANVNILYVTSSINAYNIAHISTAYAYGSTRTIPYLLKYIFPVSLLYYHNIITILLTHKYQPVAILYQSNKKKKILLENDSNNWKKIYSTMIHKLWRINRSLPKGILARDTRVKRGPRSLPHR